LPDPHWQRKPLIEGVSPTGTASPEAG
jgi:hypothetical protein